MFEIATKYDTVKVYAETIEAEAIGQITQMANSPIGENAHIRIMPDCLTEDTEVLTPSGFKLISSLKKEDKVANYNPNDGTIFFGFPRNVIFRAMREDEKIYEYFNKQHNFSFCVSENHRMAIVDSMGVLAKEIIKIPMKNMIFNGKGINTKSNYTDNEIRLIAWIVGDGNIKITNNQTSINKRIRFGLKKERKITRLLELLRLEGIEYSIFKTEKQTEIYCNTESSKKFIALVGEDKKYPLDFYTLNYEQATVFLEEAIQVDGDYEAYIQNRGYRISSKRKEDIDLFSALIGVNYGYGKINKKKSSKLYYINAISHSKLQYSKSGLHSRIISRKEIAYNGGLVCIECDSSFFIARQKGLVFVTGNCHAGKGCTIGTTMIVTDKVCPNVVGVDIGCGVNMVRTNIDFGSRLEELDKTIRKRVPFGHDNFKTIQIEAKVFEEGLYCWDKLSANAQASAMRSCGSLGGGNHFIEAYADGYISVHSGSRNLGLQIAKYYQSVAEMHEKAKRISSAEEIKHIPPHERSAYFKELHSQPVYGDLAYLTGGWLEQYLHDAHFATQFAENSRQIMLSNIIKGMGGIKYGEIVSTHNYISQEGSHGILRKGAIEAKKDQLLVIPLSMRDGMLICQGKGNTDWNCSAPHGAGRLYSRSKAKQLFTLEEYQASMEGIFSTCINTSTIDEAPFAYKNWEEIARLIEPTVDILQRVIPIYNFKAN